ncbi:MAG: hypothetical protein AAGL24_11330 [Pseudomonadota bacterium]
MSASPMRSIIRVLADSPLVERIALDHENNNVKVFYRNDQKNAASIEEMIDVINYYFGHKFNVPNALTLVEKNTEKKIPKSSSYHINSYTSAVLDLLRIDIHDKYVDNEDYYNPEKDILKIELSCLQRAKNFILSQMQTQKKPKTCTIEFNYANFKEKAQRDRYLSDLHALPKSIVKNIGVSLVRVTPEESVEDINATLTELAKAVGSTGLSMVYDGNPEALEKALETTAGRVFVAIDFKRVQDEKTIEALNSKITEHKRARDVFIIQMNIESKGEKKIGESANTLKYTGRESIT